MFHSLRIAALACLLIIPHRSATAHSWYPHECCHDRDCAVVEATEFLKSGELRVTTVHGVGLVRDDTSIRASRDNSMHACLRQIGPDEEHLGWQLICLFVPGII